MPLIISLGIFVVGGPCLAFPELLPAQWRAALTITLTLAALASATWTLRPITPLRWPVALLAGALALNVVIHTDAPLVSLRHASGTALGMLAMALLAVGASTESRYRLACGLIGFGALVLVLGGVGSTYFGWDGQKLVLGSTSEQQKLLYPWLPQSQLPLPGLEREGGWINANALGGTALMVLPFLVGLAAAATRASGWIRVAGLTVGVPGLMLSLAAIWMSRSRTALLATVILGTIVAIAWRPTRRYVVALLLVGAVAFAVVLNMRRQAAPEIFDAGVAATITNLETRASYWRLALETLADHPVLGIGVSQFHEGPPDASGQRPYVAHAHNIFLQVALDVGIVGLAGYLWIFGWGALRARHTVPTVAGLITAGAALSLVATHLFGLTDAIALGAKVGLFQWLCAGIVMAEWYALRKLSPSQP